MHPVNIGRLALGRCPGRCRARPRASRRCSRTTRSRSPGREVCILGRGFTLGRPLALLLSQKRPTANAAVTVVHTGVPDWPELHPAGRHRRRRGRRARHPPARAHHARVRWWSAAACATRAASCSPTSTSVRGGRGLDHAAGRRRRARPRSRCCSATRRSRRAHAAVAARHEAPMPSAGARSPTEPARPAAAAAARSVPTAVALPGVRGHARRHAAEFGPDRRPLVGATLWLTVAASRSSRSRCSWWRSPAVDAAESSPPRSPTTTTEPARSRYDGREDHPEPTASSTSPTSRSSRSSRATAPASTSGPPRSSSSTPPPTKHGKTIEWKEVLAGREGVQRDRRLAARGDRRHVPEYLIGIKGPLTTPIGGGIRTSTSRCARSSTSTCACARCAGSRACRRR